MSSAKAAAKCQYQTQTHIYLYVLLYMCACILSFRTLEAVWHLSSNWVEFICICKYTHSHSHTQLPNSHELQKCWIVYVLCKKRHLLTHNNTTRGQQQLIAWRFTYSWVGFVSTFCEKHSTVTHKYTYSHKYLHTHACIRTTSVVASRHLMLLWQSFHEGSSKFLRQQATTAGAECGGSVFYCLNLTFFICI